MNPTLEELISQHKGGRSYAQLAKDCDNQVTAGNLQRMGSQPPKTFPGPETINGLARGLHIPNTQVLHAIATSLGMHLQTNLTHRPDEDGADSTPNNEQIYYWQNHAATYRTRYHALRNALHHPARENAHPQPKKPGNTGQNPARELPPMDDMESGRSHG
ncbi:hypothetical protein [Zhihengliuella halotolerans]|uniref:hypothetical protein n=1 Tax=Zhihengliuella halotolerans TaxID=370736 RepID=UPI000C803A81|nr:hypothetical protein [Zhihengliuella halotolerans]